MNRFYFGLKSKKMKDSKTKSSKSKSNQVTLDPLNAKTIMQINKCKSYSCRIYSNLKPYAETKVNDLRGEKILMEIFKTSIDLYIKFNNMYHCYMAKELNHFINQMSVEMRNMTDNTDIFRVKNSKKEQIEFDFNHGLKT